MDKFNKATDSKYWPGFRERRRNPCSLLVQRKTCKLPWESVWRIFKELKIIRPYDPTIVSLGICPNNLTFYSTDTTLAMFTVPYSQKQIKCPSTNEQRTETCCTYTMNCRDPTREAEGEPFKGGGRKAK